MTISIGTLAMTVLYLIITAIVWWLLDYLVDQVNPKEPIKRVCKIILLVAAVFIAIGVLLSLVGINLVTFRP
jgi:hypothetical protein